MQIFILNFWIRDILRSVIAFSKAKTREQPKASSSLKPKKNKQEPSIPYIKNL